MRPACRSGISVGKCPPASEQKASMGASIPFVRPPHAATTQHSDSISSGRASVKSARHCVYSEVAKSFTLRNCSVWNLRLLSADRSLRFIYRRCQSARCRLRLDFMVRNKSKSATKRLK
jgi:hypothetical protein